MKIRKRKFGAITMSDYIKAARKGSRSAEQEILGPGFHSIDKTHRSKKMYTRKPKHRGAQE